MTQTSSSNCRSNFFCSSRNVRSLLFRTNTASVARRRISSSRRPIALPNSALVFGVSALAVVTARAPAKSSWNRFWVASGHQSSTPSKASTTAYGMAVADAASAASISAPNPSPVSTCISECISSFALSTSIRRRRTANVVLFSP